MTENPILSTQPVFQGKFIQLDIQRVRLPDGTYFDFELIRHPGGAGIVAIDTNGRVLLVRQYRPGAAQPLWELPAGVLNPNESPENCAVRELQEETGYKPGNIEYLSGFFAAPGYSDEYLYLFLATDLIESSLPRDDGEFLEVAHFPLGEALAMLDTGEIVEAKTIIGLLRVAARPDIMF